MTKEFYKDECVTFLPQAIQRVDESLESKVELMLVTVHVFPGYNLYLFFVKIHSSFL